MIQFYLRGENMFWKIEERFIIDRRALILSEKRFPRNPLALLLILFCFWLNPRSGLKSNNRWEGRELSLEKHLDTLSLFSLINWSPFVSLWWALGLSEKRTICTFCHGQRLPVATGCGWQDPYISITFLSFGCRYFSATPLKHSQTLFNDPYFWAFWKCCDPLLAFR